MVKATQWEIIPATLEATTTVAEEAILEETETTTEAEETIRGMRTSTEDASPPEEVSTMKEVCPLPLARRLFLSSHSSFNNPSTFVFHVL